MSQVVRPGSMQTAPVPPTGGPSTPPRDVPVPIAANAPGRLALAALALGLVAQLLFFGVPLGVNVPLWIALVLVAAWLARSPEAKLDRHDAWLPLAALLFAGFVALRADRLLVAFDSLAAIGLTAASVAAFAGVPVTRRSVAAVTAIGGWGFAVAMRGALPLWRRIRPGEALGAVAHLSPPALAVVRGLVIAVPLVVVFGALFASADAVFARVAADALDISFDLGDLPGRAVIAVIAGWLCAAVLCLVARDAPAPPTAEPARLPRFVGSIEATVVLIALDVLFAAFVVLQVAYLFGGRDTLDASGFTYSEYARRGFFELIAVAVLVGGIIVVLEAVVAKRTAVYLAAGVALVGLTAVVLASAFLRLRLYQDAYGWTELRFYSLAAIAWLAICLVIAAVTLMAARTRWLLHGVAIAALIVAAAVNVLDPPAFVAQENVARALEPARVPPDGETGFDVEYAALILSDDAIPAVVEALPRLRNVDTWYIRRALARRRLELAQPENRAWQGWNLARERARQALESAGPDLGGSSATMPRPWPRTPVPS